MKNSKKLKLSIETLRALTVDAPQKNGEVPNAPFYSWHKTCTNQSF